MRKPALLLTLASLTFWLAACAPNGEQPGAGEGTAQPEATSAEAGATAPDAEAPSATAEGESVGGAAAGTPASQGGGSAAGAAGTSGDQMGSGGGQSELVASVNGKPILLAEFQRQAWDTQRYFMDQGGIDPNTPDGQQQLLYLRRQVLSDMINQALLEQAADEMKITATEAEAEASLARYIEEIGGEEKFEQSLVDTGSTREQVLEMERASLIGKKMLDQIAADVPETAEFVHARHILCKMEADCQAVLTRLDGGEDFATIARELSEDQTTKDRGGDLDWITMGMLPSQELEEAMFALQAGQRSDVVKTDFGYHVIEVLERDPSRALDEAQRVQLKEKKLMQWQEERRQTADIVIYVEDLKADMASPAGPAATPTPGG